VLLFLETFSVKCSLLSNQNVLLKKNNTITQAESNGNFNAFSFRRKFLKLNGSSGRDVRDVN
jgi:hypothetical protein